MAARVPEFDAYERALRMAIQGHLADARGQYQALAESAADPDLQALVENDLGALEAVTGSMENARRHFE
jgi:hypothetical protein